MQNSTRFLFGVILIFLGILFLIEQTGFFVAFGFSLWRFVWMFWPLILIFLGAKLLAERNTSGGFVLLILGTVLLTTTLFSWNFFAVLWPLLIIALGFSILIKRDTGSFNTTKRASSRNSSSEDRINETVIFWGLEKSVVSKNFKGGEVNVAFGGCELNLRDAVVAKEGAKLHINCAFGGVEVFVPKGCRVITNGTGILGGWSPQLKPNDITEPVFEITGSVAFGGVEIKD
jgi:predicted membrane protein